MNIKFSVINKKKETLEKLEKKVNGVESDLCKLWNVVPDTNTILTEKLHKIADNVSLLKLAVAESQSAIPK